MSRPGRDHDHLRDMTRDMTGHMTRDMTGDARPEAATCIPTIGLLTGDARPVTDALLARMAALSEQEQFEDAGTVRDRLLHLVRAAARTQRIAPLAVQPADRRGTACGWTAGGSWSASATASWPVPA